VGSLGCDPKDQQPECRKGPTHKTDVLELYLHFSSASVGAPQRQKGRESCAAEPEGTVCLVLLTHAKGWYRDYAASGLVQAR